jgi:hypothetical protein
MPTMKLTTNPLLPICLLLLLLTYDVSAQEIPRGRANITFVDGVEMDAEVLFVHPNAPRLIVRSPQNRTVQSLDLKQIHQVRVGGQTQTPQPRRPLTEAEQLERQRNGLWVDAVDSGQIGRYAQQTWEARPAIVWRHPGQSGNALEAEQWLNEEGQPLIETPWRDLAAAPNRVTKGADAQHFDGDVLLPAAETEYSAIQPGNRDHLKGHSIRHLTVENNASYNVRYTILGNLWMKDGAALGKGTQTGGFGSGEPSRHSVARFCNFGPHDLDKGIAAEDAWAHAPGISHWVRIDTGSEGSLEIVGLTGGPSDRLTLARGTLIVSENSFIGNGNRGSFYTQEGTTTVLLDGARVGCPDPITRDFRSTYGIGGTLLFGTPEHPLQKDLVFDATYYPLDRVSPTASPAERTQGASFVLGPTGKMIVHSADPKRARVIFRPRPRQLPWSQYAVSREHWTLHKENPLQLWEQGQLPQGVTAVFRGVTDFNGVIFDGFYEGGIVVDPAARKRWQNVGVGESNHVAGDRLFRDLTVQSADSGKTRAEQDKQ